MEWASEYRKQFEQDCATADTIKPVEVVPTGIIGIDNRVIRRGGFPRGMTIEIAGKFSSGKTTLAARIIKAYQEAGLTVVYFDVEGRVDRDWFAKIGVDLKKMFVPEAYGSEVLTQTKFFVAKGIDLIVIDSVNFVIPTIVMERPNEDLSMKQNLARAAMWKAFSHDLQGGFSLHKEDKVYKIRKSQSTVLLLNHLYDSVDGFVKKSETLGGEGVKNACSVRLFLEKITRKEELLDNEQIFRSKIKCFKSSVAPPFGEAVLSFNLTTGDIGDDWESILVIAKEKKVVEQRGGYYYICSDELPKSMRAEEVIQYLKGNRSVVEGMFS